MNKCFIKGDISEGALRSAGFWVIGGKRIISSLIFSCFVCRKHRGKQQIQIMADFPADRVNPAPPFSYVGGRCVWSLDSCRKGN